MDPPNAAEPNVQGMLALVLFAAPLLAWPASMLLLNLYRRAVVRMMGLRLRTGSTEPADAAAVQPAAPAGLIEILELHPSRAAGDSRYADAERHPWRAAAAYTAGGFSCAAVMAIAQLVASETSVLPLRFALVSWCYFWPAVLVVNIVAAVRRSAKAVVVAFYLAIFLLLGLVATGRSEGYTLPQHIFLFVLLALLPSLPLLAFNHRRIRSVGPMVLSFMLLALAGSNAVLWLFDAGEGVQRTIVRLGVNLGLGGSAIFVGLIVFGFALFGVIGWKLLRLVGRLYERKIVSDQSIVIDSIWIFFASAQAVSLFRYHPLWLLSAVAGFTAYKCVAAFALALATREMRRVNYNTPLLLLRVFSLGDRSQRLFDALVKRWRYIGNVHLIAGPDLATTTIEPHEFLQFASGKLGHLFIDSVDSLEQRTASIDTARDFGGRFRVHDFFCIESTWKAALEKLAGRSDVVLMDLRGFSSANAGCIYEIAALMRLVPLERVTFLIDSTTDETLLRQTVHDAWMQLPEDSPNRKRESAPFRLLRVEDVRVQLSRVLTSLTTSRSDLATTAA